MKAFPPLLEYALFGADQSSTIPSAIDEHVIQRLFESFLCADNEIKRSFIVFLQKLFMDNRSFQTAISEEGMDGVLFQREYAADEGRPDFVLMSKDNIPILALELKWNANADQEQIERYLSLHSVKGVLLISRKKSQYKPDKTKPLSDSSSFRHILYHDLNDWIGKSLLSINGCQNSEIDDLLIHRYANLLALYSLVNSFSKEEAVNWLASQVSRVVAMLKQIHIQNKDKNPTWKPHLKNENISEAQIKSLIRFESTDMVFCLTREIPSWSHALLAVGIKIEKKQFKAISKLIKCDGSYTAACKKSKAFVQNTFKFKTKQGGIIHESVLSTYKKRFPLSFKANKTITNGAWTNASCSEIAGFLYGKLEEFMDKIDDSIRCFE